MLWEACLRGSDRSHAAECTLKCSENTLLLTDNPIRAMTCHKYLLRMAVCKKGTGVRKLYAHKCTPRSSDMESEDDGPMSDSDMYNSSPSFHCPVCAGYFDSTGTLREHDCAGPLSCDNTPTNSDSMSASPVPERQIDLFVCERCGVSFSQQLLAREHAARKENRCALCPPIVWHSRVLLPVSINTEGALVVDFSV